MNDEPKIDPFLVELEREILRLRNDMAETQAALEDAEALYAKRTGGEVVPRPETRYAYYRQLAKAMEKALENLDRPVAPEALLKELESGGFGFDPKFGKAARITNMGRSHKLSGKQTVKINENGEYVLIAWESR